MVIHTREGHQPDLSDCPPAKLNRGAPSKRIGDPGKYGRILIRGEYGHDIVDELAPIDGEVVIDKPGKGAFYATELQDILVDAGITQLLVTGVTTEVCVHTTTREANDRGYECLVVSDCVGSYFPEFQRIGLEMIKAQGGIFGWVADSAAVIPALHATDHARPPERTRMSTDVTDPPTDAPVEPPERPTMSIPWWTRGDTNAFFGLGFNILVNVLTLTGLMIGVDRGACRATCSAPCCPRSASR